MDADRILPHVLVGSCPAEPDDVARLKSDLGVTAVLSLQTDEDFDYLGIDWRGLEAAYRASAMQVRRVPVTDFNREELRRMLSECVEALDELLREGHTVLVHCTAGVNRSPSTVVAYLHWIEGLPLDEAVRVVTQRRSCDPYVEAIRLATEDRGKGP